MRIFARAGGIVALVFALFAVITVASRLDAPGSGPVPHPSPYGYPEQVRR